MTSTILSFPVLSGLRNVLEPLDKSDKPSEIDVGDDVEAEQETFSAPALNAPEPLDSIPNLDAMKAALKDVSKGVTEGTDLEYKRYYLLLTLFLPTPSTNW
jgi:hypothetical protein